ncbi:MAG TPA: DUF1704 domain-containing protein [Gammaproteobacteria bacterium]|nr:DUF1704 domain-containing protein [Gammaproteobacteria bacterium]
MAATAISPELVEEICGQLRHNGRVRRRLPGWGRVHIDRELPFLCVYRRPPDRPDAGTSRLLPGQAAYLLAPGEPAALPGLRQLLGCIAGTQVEGFGAALLLELWSAPREVAAEAGRRPAFRLVAPAQGAPDALLEAFESALLKIRLEGRPAQVALDYRERVRPPALEPLLEAQAPMPGVHILGLEVSPVYRDGATGELLPLDLRELQRTLGHALKEGFFAFAHAFTRQRPAHYHELGRHAMTPVVQEVDRMLAAIDQRFDLLLHVTPVNGAAAWESFAERGFERAPEFHYRPRPVDPDLLKRELFGVPVERIEDPTLAWLFAAKRDELERQITMVADRCSPRFLHGSLQVYAPVEEELLTQARALLAQLPPAPRGNTRLLDAGRFAERARAELDHYRAQLPQLAARVEVRDDISGVMVSHGNFLIAHEARVPVGRVEATLAHEIGTHVLTYYNGRAQPFRLLYAGMADYEPLQEGLAVLSEYLVGELDCGRLRLLAARVLAVHAVSQGAGFVDIFRELTREQGFEPRTAFDIAMRVCRGGGFTKDAVYLRGLLALLRHLGEGGELEDLLRGKIALEYLPLVQELGWRRVLQPPLLKPRHLQREQAAGRLARLRRGMTLEQLAGECGT